MTPKSSHHSRQSWPVKPHSQKIKTPKFLELSLSSAVSSTRWGSNSKPSSLPQEQKSWRTWTWSTWAVMSQKCMRTSLMKRFVLFTKSGSQNHAPAIKDLILTHSNGWRRQQDEHLQHNNWDRTLLSCLQVNYVEKVIKKSLYPCISRHIDTLD